MPGSETLKRSIATLLLLAAATSVSAASLSPAREALPPAPAARQLGAFATGQGLCDDTSVKQALALIYEQGNMAAAAEMATRCEAQGQATGGPLSRTIAARIRAVLALRVNDLAALKQAGESIVAQAPTPEYLADGHLFIAMACVLNGETRCARTHVDHAKALFTQLQVAEALSQLQPLETAVVKLEEQGE